MKPRSPLIVHRADPGVHLLSKDNRPNCDTETSEPLVADLDGGRLRRIPGDATALRLLTTYVGGIASNAILLGRTFVAHVHDLVALAIGPTLGGARIAQDRELRAAPVAGPLLFEGCRASDHL